MSETQLGNSFLFANFDVNALGTRTEKEKESERHREREKREREINMIVSEIISNKDNKANCSKVVI